MLHIGHDLAAIERSGSSHFVVTWGCFNARRCDWICVLEYLAINKLRPTVVSTDLVLPLYGKLRGLTPMYSFSISNGLNPSDLIDACQPRRHIPREVLLYKLIELLNGLFKPKPISIPIQIIPNRRYLFRDPTMINIPFNHLNNTIHHKFLRNLTSVIVIPRIILIHPHFYNSLLIYANILLLNCKKTNLLS